MHKAVSQPTRSLGFGRRSVRGVVFLCAGMLSGVMYAPSVQASQKPKADQQSKVQTPSKAASTADSKSDVASTPPGIGKAGTAVKARGGFSPLEKSARPVTRSKTVKRGRGMSQFTPDPNAKWACDKDKVELEPVWRGSQELVFGFDIRNEGTADLRIKAKGG